MVRIPDPDDALCSLAPAMDETAVKPIVITNGDSSATRNQRLFIMISLFS
jgi:hypothetical protein